MKERLHFENNQEGWLLELRQYWNPERHDPSLRPVLIIPGYCMNTFILNFHPRGDSMVKYMTDQGFEIWTANLRGQGGSRRVGGDRQFGFRAVTLTDVPTAIDFVRKQSRAEPEDIDAIGCSLGATYLYGYLAHHRDEHRLGSLVAMGGPLRWVDPHPLITFAFGSSRIANLVPIVGTRAAAAKFLPIAKRLPFVLDIYMNTDRIDLSQASELVKTVDDPIRRLNKEISHWISSRDLHVAGVNVTEAMSDIQTPLLCVLANADGIVPPDTALSVIDAIGTDDTQVLEVGTDSDWFAHADLFINDLAHDYVFRPLCDWLHRKN